MTSFKRTQRKYVQKAYRVRNWREYETGLRARGSLTVWLGLTDGKLANWNSPRPTRRKPGRQRKYSNHAIETTGTLGLVFGLASLVGQIERPIASAKADAAYDTGDVYKTLENHRAHRSPKVLIPPRKGAQLALDSAGTRQRNRNIRARSRVGKRKWYVASGYSRRSKVETTFHRYKAILGSAMRARGLASQRVEVRLGCKILNTMTALGIPDGEMIG